MVFVRVTQHKVSSFPRLLTAAFVACSTNVGEGLVKHVMCK